MLRKLLESKGLEMSDEEFAEVMLETERDIKANHILLGINSDMSYVIEVASIYYGVAKRVQI